MLLKEKEGASAQRGLAERLSPSWAAAAALARRTGSERTEGGVALALGDRAGACNA